LERYYERRRKRGGGIKMSLKYIREHYRVPAKKGMVVLAQGEKGIIQGSSRAYLRIKLDGQSYVGLWHPTWEIIYPKQKSKSAIK